MLGLNKENMVQVNFVFCNRPIDIQSLGPISGAAVILPQFDNNNNNKLANQKIEMLAFPASSLGGLLRR